MPRKTHIFTLIILLSAHFVFSQNTLNQFINEQLINYTIEQNLPKIKWCIDEGADVNCRSDNGATPLLLASEKGNLEIVKTLLYFKADPNKTAYDKFTPLMMAVFVGNLDIAEILIKQGATLDLKDDKECTALHYAVALSDFVMSDMLIFYGAKTDIKTRDLNTNLHIAAFSQDTNLVKLFINNTLDMEASNFNDFTPLMIAAQNGYYSTVEFLLKHNANANFTNPKGLNALNLAIFNKHEKVVTLLLKYLKSDNISYSNAFYNPVAAAKITSQNKLVKDLKHHGFSMGNELLFDLVTINAGANFNDKDVLFNMNLGVHDINYNLFLSLGYQTRFGGKQIYWQPKEEKYLVWEHRRIIDIGAEKHFKIWSENNSTMNAALGCDFQLVFGKYDGFKEKVKTRLIAVPQIGMVYSTLNFDYGIYYQYSKYDIIEIPNGRLKLSITAKIPTITKPLNYRLSWM